MGLGIGYSVSSVQPALGDLSARGAGVALEFAIGGTVYDGLVIGGGLFINSTGTVRWKGDGVRNFTDGTTDNLESGEGGSLGLLGLVLDYYPSPKDGFHVQAGLGIGTMSYQQNGASLPDQDWAGGGGGFMLGAGYEAWVGSQWSLGGIARVIGTTASLQSHDSRENFDGRGIAPALLFVATHH